MVKRLFLATLFLFNFCLAPAVLAIDCSKTAPTTTQEAIQCGTDNTAGVPQGGNAGKSINDTIAWVVNLISVVVGVAAVIMVLVGGVRFVSSGGNEDSIKGAKSTVTYALVGLLFVAVAQLIVHFVLYHVTQATTEPKP